MFVAVCVCVLFAASACIAQTYTITDLGPAGGTFSLANDINASGQVVGVVTSGGLQHGFRTAANTPINPATDDLGTLGGSQTVAFGINHSGQAVGWSITSIGEVHAFRTAANSPINPATDDLGNLGLGGSAASAINHSGQVVGQSNTIDGYDHGFRTAANAAINPATDDLGTLSGASSSTAAWAINDSGQVAGQSDVSGGSFHAFRTAANAAINPATDDLGTLGGAYSTATGINASGQVVGRALTSSGNYHAFCTAANATINPATDDLGTLGGTISAALGINTSGQVVGDATIAGDTVAHAFLYTNGVLHDLNDLIPAGSGWVLNEATAINDSGQIVGYGVQSDGYKHAFLLTPVIPYKAAVQEPINADGSSIFSATKGVIPIKFTLTQNNTPTCSLPPATISVTRTAGGTTGSIEESTYNMSADSGSNFRIDTTNCQYVYNLAAKSLGPGTYRVDISINGSVVGSGVFAFQ